MKNILKIFMALTLFTGISIASAESVKEYGYGNSSQVNKNTFIWSGIENNKFMAISGGFNFVTAASFKADGESGYDSCEYKDGYNLDFRFTDSFMTVNFGIESCKLRGKNFQYGNAGVAFGLPLNFNILTVKPFGKASVGFNFEIMKFGVEAGFEVLAGTDLWAVNPGIGISSGKSWCPSGFDSYKYDSIRIYGIVAF